MSQVSVFMSGIVCGCAGEPFVLNAARAPQGASVTVTTQEPVSGSVTMAVSQCD